MHSSIRVAICGAGPSGLCQLHAFESARQCGLEIPEIVCFEKQNDLGGQWNYTWRTGFDEYSEPVHTSMYHNLWANLPKECFEFVDYSFDKHFNQPFTSFPPRTVIYDYIRGYAEQNNVRQYIRFNTVIRWISYSEDTKKFNILVKDLKKDEMQSEEFDYVIIASGHFSTPNIPYFNGIETFFGRILHSHDFRSAHDFIDKNVLLIGNASSAEDIALQLYKYGSKSVTISYRTKPVNFKWPDTIKEVPLVTKIDKETIYFKDNSSEKVDTIIFCTGYLHYFPFLDDNLRLKTGKSLYPTGLYKTIVWLNQPRLFYLGMQHLTFSFNIGNLQAWYTRDIILGKINLPSTKDEMQNNITLWQTKAKPVQNFFDYIYFLKEYVLDLIAATDYPHFDIDCMVKIILDCVKARFENMLTYREKTYASAITNTMAKQHHLTWINEMNDTIDQCEEYIQSISPEDRIVLIVSDRLGEQLVPRIHQLRQITAIYIYCTDKKKNEQCANQFAKVKRVIVQLDELISQIQTDQIKRKIQNKIDEPISINVFNTSDGHGQSTSDLKGQFLHSQLLIDALLRMKSTRSDKEELISVCEKEYKNNSTELNILDEFKKDYASDRSLWWYTRESFLYRMMNKALRVQNIDLLFLFRFFIRDIGQQLEQHRCSSSICLYRGQLMSNDELQILKGSVGKLISVNSFLSTSTNRQLALSFLESSTITGDLQRVLFEIKADHQLNGIKPFANITSFSYFPDEDEVLMMLQSIFRLDSNHCEDKRVWIIQMTLCGDNDYDMKPIFDYLKQRLELEETSLYSFGQVLHDMGKLDAAEKYIHRFLSESPRNNNDIALSCHALGVITEEKGDYDSSLQWHQKSLDKWMQILKSNDPSLGDAHNCIAIVYRKKVDYKRALESYEKALTIFRRTFGNDHLKIAMCFNNIGVVYYEDKKYLKALEYYQKALAIWQKHLPPDHSHFGAVYDNIGEVHRHLHQYDLALKHHNLSLDIYQKSLHPQHPNIATVLENIGLVYEQKNEMQEALSFLEKAALIFHHALPPTNPDVIRIGQNIERVSSKLK